MGHRSAELRLPERRWYVVDAKDKILGRIASQISRLLQGKHRPEYAPHADVGDHVIVLNASLVRLTGNKRCEKIYHRHTGYPGGIRSTRFSDLIRRNPHRIFRGTVRGMLPKNSRGRSMLRRLRSYPGCDHPHRAQRPVRLHL